MPIFNSVPDTALQSDGDVGQVVKDISTSNPMGQPVGAVASLTCTQLPDVEDLVSVFDGPTCLCQMVFKGSAYGSGSDAAKLNVAQTVKDVNGNPNPPYTRVLELRVQPHGKAGLYQLAYT